MSQSDSTCPECKHELKIEGSEDQPTTCPACGKALPETASPRDSGQGLDADTLKKFGDVNKNLGDRLGNISQEASWHLAVIAEILDYEHKKLSSSLNQNQAVNSRMFNLRGNKARVDVIKERFEEYSNCIILLQDALSHYIESDCKFPGLIRFWEFYEACNEACNRLAQFHRSIVGLKFVRDSLENQIQGMMIDWVHHVIICLESLKKQLDRKSKLELPQLKVRTVEVTLASPTLHMLFDKLEQLGALEASAETDPA